MRLNDFMEKIDQQAKQMEMIGFKGDVLFTSIQQFVDKQIFKLTTGEMNDDEKKVIESLHDKAKTKNALEKYRSMKNSGNVNPEELAKEILK
ncbi:MAG: hypothetical protein Q4E33_05465 [Erysipelotrichaceae bacterium]|nr:hypothetical protein [Erysipelotrichaceae bacterium]